MAGKAEVGEITPETQQLNKGGRPYGSKSTKRPKDFWNLDAPKVEGTNCTALQLACIRDLSAGMRPGNVRQKYHIDQLIWHGWMHNPDFLAQIKNRVERLDKVVEDTLVEGEQKAAAALILALAATTPLKLANGKYHFRPDWDIRVKAAISLLDRQGQRGKPVDRALQATSHVNPNTIAKELGAALSDPAVRQFIAEDPKFAAEFRRELAALPPAPAVEVVCDSPESVPSP